MLIQQRPAPGTPHAQTLDEIFGSGTWRIEVIGDGMDERLDRAIPLMARGIGAKWWTSAVRMVTGGQATRYVLLHLTNGRWTRPDEGMRVVSFACRWLHGPPLLTTLISSPCSSPSRISVLCASGYSVG
jgi:hypothetical protein